MRDLAYDKLQPLPSATSVSIEEVDPATATQWLLRNENPRRMRGPKVKQYAGAMKRGEWVLSNDAITFDRHGRLINGQHRLSAVVMAGITMQFMVMRNSPDGLFDVADSGLGRSMGDRLDQVGETSVHALAGALVVLYRLENVIVPKATWNIPPEIWPSKPQLLELLERYLNVRRSIHVTSPAAKRFRLSRSFCAGFHGYISERSPEDADSFFQLLDSGANLAETSAIYALRRLLERDVIAPRRMDHERQAAVIVKGWNHWRRGTRLRLMKWNPEAESFPVPIR